MQPRPTMIEVLATVAEVLERDVMPATSGATQHQARVAANLVRIVERELRLGPAAAEREREALAEFLHVDDTDLPTLRGILADRLRSADADDAAIWDLLMSGVRDDLTIAKPGYTAWEGE